MTPPRRTGRSRLHRIWKLPAGFLLLALGIVLSLPLVPGPGIALILLGLVLLGDEFPWARRALEWMKSRWQRFRGKP
ncbi:MAG TPA: PGPGW domain-containing protein [Bryobacteraceae bacterium]|jgi:hypothetical protein